MTYMSPNPIVSDSDLTPLHEPVIPPQREAHEVFTPLERAVIRLSARDPVNSLEPMPPTVRALYEVFFGRRATMLADPRLEALRRFCVLLRQRKHIKEEERRRFLDAGYTESHVELLAVKFGTHGPRWLAKAHLLLPGTFLLGIVAMIYYGAVRTFDQKLPAFILGLDSQARF